jgi:Transposase DDE domain
MIGYDGHKGIKGTKVHAVVTHDSLPIAIAIGRGNEHEGRKLIPLLNSISIRKAWQG